MTRRIIGGPSREGSIFYPSSWEWSLVIPDPPQGSPPPTLVNRKDYEFQDLIQRIRHQTLIEYPPSRRNSSDYRSRPTPMVNLIEMIKDQQAIIRQLWLMSGDLPQWHRDRILLLRMESDSLEKILRNTKWEYHIVNQKSNPGII